MKETSSSNKETAIPLYRKAVHQLRNEQKKLKILVGALGITTIAFMFMSIFGLGNYKMIDAKVTELEDNYITLVKENESISNEYYGLVYYKTKQEGEIASLTSSLAIAEDQNIQLLEENEEQKKAIKELEDRQAKYDRYSYALFDTEGRRNDITYDQLLLLEQLCANSRVDVDLVLSIVMVESEGDETCKNKSSTARGYGQFLKGTGKFVYEDLMGNPKGSYNHDLALNGETNLRMMVRYLEYLYSRSSSTDSVINNYRGVKDQPYKNKLNHYLGTVGKSLGTV